MAINVTKSFVIGIFTAVTALACFILGIYAMASAVGYFGTLFTLTTQRQARSYLSLHYNAFMATLYLTIFGMIITVIGSIIYFTSMWQKDKLIVLHILFFLPFFICGLVAIVGSSVHKDTLTALVGSGIFNHYIACCSSTCQFQCSLSPFFQAYHADITVFFAIFCVFFAIYTTLHFVGCYLENSSKSQNQPNKLGNQSLSHISHISNPNNVQKLKYLEQYVYKSIQQ